MIFKGETLSQNGTPKGEKMGRLKDLRKYVDAEMEKLPDADKRNNAIVHLYGVSLASAMIAKKRGLDADVVHHCMNDLSKEVKEKEKARYESICREFGLG